MACRSCEACPSLVGVMDSLFGTIRVCKDCPEDLIYFIKEENCRHDVGESSVIRESWKGELGKRGGLTNPTGDLRMWTRL